MDKKGKIVWRPRGSRGAGGVDSELSVSAALREVRMRVRLWTVRVCKAARALHAGMARTVAVDHARTMACVCERNAGIWLSRFDMEARDGEMLLSEDETERRRRVDRRDSAPRK